MSVRAGSVNATELGSAFDVLGAYRTGGVAMVKEGSGVAGYGAVDRWTRGDDVLERLGRLGVAGGSPAPVAFGSFPFAPSLDPTWVIPAKLVRKDPRSEPWLLEIAGDEGADGTFEASRSRIDPPSEDAGTELHHVVSPEDYVTSVQRATDLIRTGVLRKVVLARAVDVDAGRPLDARRLLVRLRAIEPSCYAFAFPIAEGRHLVGASPELLVSRFGRDVRANPLAGSAGRSGDPAEDRRAADRLLRSDKDREEHAIVVDAVAERLRRFCDQLTFDAEPALEATANVWHLSTGFRGVLRDPSVTSVDLVKALHPTPAVCGEPTDRALEAIRDLERFDRGAYAGPVGWVDADGDGVWALAIRCAEISGDTARLFAGAGIVAGSDPQAELEETERKFRAFLDPLRWG